MPRILTLTTMRVIASSLLLAKAAPAVIAGSHGSGLALMTLMLVLGLLIATGLATRIAAAAAVLMLVTIYCMFHAPHGLSPITNGGVPAVLSAAIFLHLAAIGAGPWSVDGLLARRTG